MIWKLTSGATIFTISDGIGRLYQTVERLGVDLKQTTQVAQSMRSAWPRAFPDRATRELSFELPVIFPPCASLDAAFVQAQDIPVQCPNGGVLTGQLDAELRTYSQAWINDVRVEPLGVRNKFIFAISAINPTSTTLSLLAQMDSRYVANLSAITGLTGGGSTNIDALVTVDVPVGFVAFCSPVIRGIAQPKHFKLTAIATAQNLDPTAGALKVRPLDYDATTNIKFWIEI